MDDLAGERSSPSEFEGRGVGTLRSEARRTAEADASRDASSFDGPAARLPPRASSRRASIRRAAGVTVGFVSLALGGLGVFLPLLPTTPLVLLAAACFARSSPRCHALLARHRLFGPIIRQWQTERTVPVRAKWIALLTVTLAFAWSLWAVPNCLWGYLLLFLIGSGLVIFLARLPTPSSLPARLSDSPLNPPDGA